MKLPFVKWISTREGAITMTRLASFLMFPATVLVEYDENAISHYPISGFFLFFIGVLIMIKTVHMFLTRKEFKTMLDGETNFDIVTDGPYEFTRHPFYLGFAIMFGGLCLMFMGYLTLINFAVYCLFTYLACNEEEKRLLNDFPLDYKLYQIGTPMFFPTRIIGFFRSILIRN